MALGGQATIPHDSNTQTTPAPKKGRKQQVTKSRTARYVPSQFRHGRITLPRARNIFAYIHMTIDKNNTLNEDFAQIYESLPGEAHQV